MVLRIVLRKHLRGDAEERSEVLQGKMLNNAGTTLQQQLIAFAGCGAMEVEVAGTGLTEQVLSYDTAQLHLFSVLTEKVHQLLAAYTEHATGHHRLDQKEFLFKGGGAPRKMKKSFFLENPLKIKDNF